MKALTRGRYSFLCCFLFEVWLLLFFAHGSDHQVFVFTISVPAIMHLYIKYVFIHNQIQKII